jgi:AcrR family transcriptional regulator
VAPPRSDSRERLLAAAVEHVASAGVAGLSLRDLAAAIGTSHRMLVYHFGSKAGLLAEVVRVVEEGQRAQIAAIVDAPDGSPYDDVRAMWEHWRDPASQRLERLFFEMVGMALQGDPAMRPLLDDLIEPWLEPVAAVRRAAGVAPADATADARLALAVTRGLLLDLLATGDQEGTTRAFERFGELMRMSERPQSPRRKRSS